MKVTKEEIKERAMITFQNWVASTFEEDVEKILRSGLVDFDKAEGNFLDSYPIFAAILQKSVDSAIYGSSYEHTRRSQKRKMNLYMHALWAKLKNVNFTFWAFATASKGAAAPLSGQMFAHWKKCLKIMGYD